MYKPRWTQFSSWNADSMSSNHYYCYQLKAMNRKENRILFIFSTTFSLKDVWIWFEPDHNNENICLNQTHQVPAGTVQVSTLSDRASFQFLHWLCAHFCTYLSSGYGPNVSVQHNLKFNPGKFWKIADRFEEKLWDEEKSIISWPYLTTKSHRDRY